MKPRFVMIVLVSMLLTVGFQSINVVDADSLSIEFDDINDVMYSDNFNQNNTTFVIANNPDCDIANLTVFIHSNNNKIIVILNMNPEGEIVNQNDLNTTNNPQKEGRTVYYYGVVETNLKTYYFSYSNYTCHTSLAGITDDYAIYENQLVIIMNLTRPDEKIIFSGGYCYDLRNDSINGTHIYIDYVPNDLMVNVGFNNPYSSFVNEEITFESYYYDWFGILEPPFTFKWDFGDGNTATGKTVNHTYFEPGVYTVRLLFNDSAEHYAFREEIIDINRPIHNRYQVTWTKKTGSLDLYTGVFIAKNQVHNKNYRIISPDYSVLTNVETTLEWYDDNTHGLDGSKGQDRLEVTLQKEMMFNNDSSVGSGKHVFNHDIYSIPNDFIVSADNYDEAEQKVRSIMREKNTGFFHLEVTINTGEKIFRLFKFLQDKGNPIDLFASYDYYTYEIDYIFDY